MFLENILTSSLIDNIIIISISLLLYTIGKFIKLFNYSLVQLLIISIVVQLLATFSIKNVLDKQCDNDLSYTKYKTKNQFEKFITCSKWASLITVCFYVGAILIYLIPLMGLILIGPIKPLLLSTMGSAFYTISLYLMKNFIFIKNNCDNIVDDYINLIKF